MLDDLLATDADDDGEKLGLPKDLPDTKTNRAFLRTLQTHRDFVRSFPFDVLNLDLESYLFKPKESVPGRLVNALRRVFEWQKRPLRDRGGQGSLDGFVLMFTTRIGPANMGDSFLQMLRDALHQNIEVEPSLRPLLRTRVGHDDVQRLQGESFEHFFRLAVPKVLAKALMETDWYIDPKEGVLAYEFARSPENVEPYRMLHFVAHVRRHLPPFDQRPPGQESAVALEAYRQVVRGLFERPQVAVTPEVVASREAELKNDLDAIDARRLKYRSTG